MRWKPKYYIVFPYKMVDEIKWSEGWGCQCAGNLSEMLREVLNTKSIGSEIKLIWGDGHRYTILKEYNVTNHDLDNYISSRCSMLSFKSEFIMKRALKALTKMGATEFITVDNYRDVILKQAEFKMNGCFTK